MNKIFEQRKSLKQKLKNRERLFAGWISYSHPSITETFARAGFDFIAIDMEHSTISVEQSQRIIAACQSEGIPCIPRPVSHSNDWLKPILESGADGMLIQMVNTPEQIKLLINNIKFPPLGNRSFGVSRAQAYGFDFDKYVETWNADSIFMIQVESIQAVENIEALLDFEEIDGVMVGPYDISGSLGVPGQLSHPLVLEASERVIKACEKFGKSCGTQIVDVGNQEIEAQFELGYTYSILSSDLFVLWRWAEKVGDLMETFRKRG